MRQVRTGGLRNELPLSANQRAEALEYAQELGMPARGIRFSETMNTGYKNVFGQEILYIGTDVFPSAGRGLSANTRISMRAALAHEILGHRAAELAGRTQAVGVLEEAQASIRAARFGPGLSRLERFTLLRDAVTRLRGQQIRVRDVRHGLWIDSP